MPTYSHHSSQPNYTESSHTLTPVPSEVIQQHICNCLDGQAFVAFAQVNKYFAQLARGCRAHWLFNLLRSRMAQEQSHRYWWQYAIGQGISEAQEQGDSLQQEQGDPLQQYFQHVFRDDLTLNQLTDETYPHIYGQLKDLAYAYACSDLLQRWPPETLKRRLYDAVNNWRRLIHQPQQLPESAYYSLSHLMHGRDQRQILQWSELPSPVREVMELESMLTLIGIWRFVYGANQSVTPLELNEQLHQRFQQWITDYDWGHPLTSQGILALFTPIRLDWSVVTASCNQLTPQDNQRVCRQYLHQLSRDDYTTLMQSGPNTRQAFLRLIHVIQDQEPIPIVQPFFQAYIQALFPEIQALHPANSNDSLSAFQDHPDWILDFFQFDPIRYKFDHLPQVYMRLLDILGSSSNVSSSAQIGLILSNQGFMRYLAYELMPRNLADGVRLFQKLMHAAPLQSHKQNLIFDPYFLECLRFERQYEQVNLPPSYITLSNQIGPLPLPLDEKAFTDYLQREAPELNPDEENILTHLLNYSEDSRSECISIIKRNNSAPQRHHYDLTQGFFEGRFGSKSSWIQCLNDPNVLRLMRHHPVFQQSHIPDKLQQEDFLKRLTNEQLVQLLNHDGMARALDHLLQTSPAFCKRLNNDCLARLVQLEPHCIPNILAYCEPYQNHQFSFEIPYEKLFELKRGWDMSTTLNTMTEVVQKLNDIVHSRRQRDWDFYHYHQHDQDWENTKRNFQAHRQQEKQCWVRLMRLILNHYSWDDLNRELSHWLAQIAMNDPITTCQQLTRQQLVGLLERAYSKGYLARLLNPVVDSGNLSNAQVIDVAQDNILVAEAIVTHLGSPLPLPHPEQIQQFKDHHCLLLDDWLARSAQQHELSAELIQALWSRRAFQNLALKYAPSIEHLPCSLLDIQRLILNDTEDRDEAKQLARSLYHNPQLWATRSELERNRWWQLGYNNAAWPDDKRRHKLARWIKSTQNHLHEFSAKLQELHFHFNKHPIKNHSMLDHIAHLNDKITNVLTICTINQADQSTEAIKGNIDQWDAFTCFQLETQTKAAMEQLVSTFNQCCDQLDRHSNGKMRRLIDILTNLLDPVLAGAYQLGLTRVRYTALNRSAHANDLTRQCAGSLSQLTSNQTRWPFFANSQAWQSNVGDCRWGIDKKPGSKP